MGHCPSTGSGRTVELIDYPFILSLSKDKKRCRFASDLELQGDPDRENDRGQAVAL